MSGSAKSRRRRRRIRAAAQLYIDTGAVPLHFNEEVRAEVPKLVRAASEALKKLFPPAAVTWKKGQVRLPDGRVLGFADTRHAAIYDTILFEPIEVPDTYGKLQLP